MRIAENSKNVLLLENGEEWLKFDICKKNVEVDKAGNAKLTPKQAIRLAQKICEFYCEFYESRLFRKNCKHILSKSRRRTNSPRRHEVHGDNK